MPSARAFVFAFLLFSYAAFAQTANTVFGAGYSVPVPIKVAPGQIVNLYVQGIGANLTSASPPAVYRCPRFWQGSQYS